MPKKIEFDALALEEVRQINNTLLQDLIAVARAGDLGFAGPKGKDHVEGGWTRGGDHVKGGWTRGAALPIEAIGTPSEVPGLGKELK